MCQELEKRLAAKEASLPPEPSSDDENAVTLLVRMPDGSRRGRRFLRSDILQVKLCQEVFFLFFFFPFFVHIIAKPVSGPFQSLFDFIDIGRVVKPGAYRLVSKPCCLSVLFYGRTLNFVIYLYSCDHAVSLLFSVQVRPYPRRAFSDGESASTLDELGLTNKQEALFLELI